MRLNPLQEFCLNNIYCAPSIDAQYRVAMSRVTSPNAPMLGHVDAYQKRKQLPDLNTPYHVFTIGNYNPKFFNLLRQGHDWFNDEWVRLSDDMAARDYVAKVYSENGVLFPVQDAYYSFINESAILVVVSASPALTRKLPVAECVYLHVYTPSFFDSTEYTSKRTDPGVKVLSRFVANNVEKRDLQATIAGLKTDIGDVLVYVNGLLTDAMTLDIPDDSRVEVIYDASIKEKFILTPNDLLPFVSVKDNRRKYLVFRDKVASYIEFSDDIEVYVLTSHLLVNKGRYVPNHYPYVLRNVTNKDYSLDAATLDRVLDTSNRLDGGVTGEKRLLFVVRNTPLKPPLIYSKLRLHELYKLNGALQKRTLLNATESITELRAETLENSEYFRLSDAGSLANLTAEKCLTAIGYHGTVHYFGQSYAPVKKATIDIPPLYRDCSTAFEYDNNGKLLRYRYTTGPAFITDPSVVSHVEFLYGVSSSLQEPYFVNGERTDLPSYRECLYFTAAFLNGERTTPWVKVSKDSVVDKTGIVFGLANNTKLKVLRYDRPIFYEETIQRSIGAIRFPIKVWENRGLGFRYYLLDHYPSNLDLYLNGKRLTPVLDYTIDFPYVNITNKSYLTDASTEQRIFVRAYGYVDNVALINAGDTYGFMNNGVAIRDRKYNLRDDRNFCAFIDGCMVNKTLLRYADTDTTLRPTDPLNGKPYLLTEPCVSIFPATDSETLIPFKASLTDDQSFNQFFTKIFPEPSVTLFNVIGQRHQLFSPLMSRLITDINEGTFDMSPFMDHVDTAMLAEKIKTMYSDYLSNDPTKLNLSFDLIDISPYIGEVPVSVAREAYRVLDRVNRQFLDGKINLSGNVRLK